MLETICVPGLTFPADGCFQHLAMRVENIEVAKEKLEAAGIETEELVYAQEDVYKRQDPYGRFTVV